MKTVTRWKHPSTSAALILEGTPESTLEEAKQYFGEQPELLVGAQEEMREEDFDALDEFSG